MGGSFSSPIHIKEDLMVETLILCFASALVFMVVRLLLAGKVSAAWIDFASFGLGLLVFASQSLLGWKL